MKAFAESTYKTGLISFITYTLFSISILIYGSVLIAAMNPDNIDITTTNIYLRLETIAFMIGIIVSFVNVVFVVVGKAKNVYIFLGIKTILAVIVDFLVIPNFGVFGVAISNIFVNTILAVVCFWFLYSQKYIKFCWFKKSDFAIFKEWCKVGVFSGIQQFMDNFIYAVMICKMVNLVAEQGNYWVANNFIWGWLLIPISALSEVIRSDCKNGYKELKKSNYYFIAGSVIALWAISIPTWLLFFQYVENLSNAEEIFTIVLKLAPFYIAYAGCVIIDNIFVGLGKMTYNAINSLIINLVYYGVFYALYLMEAITFDMNTIILMFGFGMVAHWAVSIIMERVYVYRHLNKE